MNNDTTLHAKDLTQLSSREQLSALMDGALPPDETRFLLRRLQHDAPLAGCWERWRMTGEVMRGLAPAQRLPADFAGRVAVALHGGDVAPRQAAPARGSVWWRWGGGAAMAASLAVAVLAVGQPATRSAVAPAAVVAVSSPMAVPTADAVTRVPTGVPAEAQALAAATALAAVARPIRASRRSPRATSTARLQTASARATYAASAEVAAAADPMPMLAQTDIATRPWPRSVLPQYASDGLSVGFGGRVGNPPYNPFQGEAVVGNLPVVGDGLAQPSAGVDASAVRQASGTEPRR